MKDSVGLLKYGEEYYNAADVFAEVAVPVYCEARSVTINYHKNNNSGHLFSGTVALADIEG